MYLEPSRKHTMKLFGKHSQRTKAAKIGPRQVFDWALNNASKTRNRLENYSRRLRLVEMSEIKILKENFRT